MVRRKHDGQGGRNILDKNRTQQKNKERGKLEFCVKGSKLRPKCLIGIKQNSRWSSRDRDFLGQE